MQIYTRFLHTILSLAAVMVFVFMPGNAVAQQEDDPNLDQVPAYLLGNSPRQNPLLSSVISISNWDNFNLGVDVAENMMMAHPGIPTWYFTAYNINGTHHTEDGYSWLINNPSFGVGVAGDPVAAYDSLGNLFYENMYGSPIAGCKVVKSTNNGLTWEPAVTAISGNDKCWIACDQTSGPYANYIYATMTDNGVGNFTRSTDHGAVFQLTEQFTTQSVPGMMVCVGPDASIQGGSVYVVTNSGSSFASTYTFYRSTDGGLNFTLMSAQNFAGYVGTYYNNRNSVEGMRTRPYPYIAADNSYGPDRGRLYLVYASNDPPGNNNKPDIWCRYSTDNGSTWSAANRVNDDTDPDQHNQWHPAIWCDKETGRLYVQWMDTRDCPTSDSALIYASYSDDGGVSFVENQPISNEKMKISCSTCGGSGDPRYQGDYNGIISNKKVSILGWTDFRDGTFMSMTGYFPDFAVALDKTADTLYTPLDSTLVTVSVPEVKLYSDTVLVSAIVNPVPAIGTISFSYPLGNTLTAFPGEIPVKVKVEGLVPNGLYQLVFTTQGPNGTPVHKRTLNLRIMLGDVFLVEASATPDTVCQGAPSQLLATIFNGTAPFTYEWTPTTGLSDPTIENPIANPVVSTVYHISVTDATATSVTDSVLLNVLMAPGTPGLITGPDAVCQNSITGYSVFPVIGATTYSWTVPAGATIVTGQNTTAITVQWTDTPGTISVIAGNDCGTSPPSVLVITMLDPPAPPVEILGSSTGCKDLPVNLHVDTVPGASQYNWIVPAGATIISGQGTTAIVVLWGSTSGNVSVSAENDCGISASVQKFLPVDSLPMQAQSMTGNDSVCVNHAGYVYSIPEVINATAYVWSVPEGSTISSGSASNVITLDFSPQAVSGTISVYAINDCGAGLPSTKGIIVSPCAGIHENNLDADVDLFPNPASGTLNVRIRGNETGLDITISDIHGKSLYHQTLENLPGDYSMSVDVSGFAEGVYFLRLINEGRIFNGKFVVKQ